MQDPPEPCRIMGPAEIIDQAMSDGCHIQWSHSIKCLLLSLYARMLPFESFQVWECGLAGLTC
jgi:hypothetical protein